MSLAAAAARRGGSSGRLEKTDGLHPSGYDALRLVSLRLDPCAARGNAGCHSEVRAVFRPCDDRPMADFRWLGDGVWAERHGAYDDPDVGWTFHRGDRTLGELPGIDLD